MHMSPFFAEMVGTAILILLGNGVVANVVLKGTKGHGAGWIVITFGWGMAVFVGVFCTAEFSSAHLNPAVTIAMAIGKKTLWKDVPSYILAQMIGAIVGAVLVYLFYRDHFNATDDPDLKMACFCTSPAIPNYRTAFFCEMLGTFVLVFPIFLISSPWLPQQTGGTKINIGLGTLGALPVGLLVFAIGMSLGGTTGYAINPARDLGPRLAHAFLPIKGKRDGDWSYAWIPVVAPIVGGALAAAAARAITAATP
ncbi:MAG TPA: MIP/aquaporin family protein [Tepidisphaeraceae bacterium]|jgi:glycerol uptake facilitator protein